MSCTNSGCTSAVAAHRAADVRLRLQHEHRPAGVGEVVGGDQPVGPGADHDGVVGQRSVPSRTGVMPGPPLGEVGQPAQRLGVAPPQRRRPAAARAASTPGPDTASSSMRHLGAPCRRRSAGCRPRPRPTGQARARSVSDIPGVALEHLGVVVEEQRPGTDRVVQPGRRRPASRRRPRASGRRRPPTAGRASRRPAPPRPARGWRARCASWKSCRPRARSGQDHEPERWLAW